MPATPGKSFLLGAISSAGMFKRVLVTAGWQRRAAFSF